MSARWSRRERESEIARRRAAAFAENERMGVARWGPGNPPGMGPPPTRNDGNNNNNGAQRGRGRRGGYGRGRGRGDGRGAPHVNPNDGQPDGSDWEDD